MNNDIVATLPIEGTCVCCASCSCSVYCEASLRRGGLCTVSQSDLLVAEVRLAYRLVERNDWLVCMKGVCFDEGWGGSVC